MDGGISFCRHLEVTFLRLLYGVICRTVAMIFKHWAVFSMLPMLSELCSCSPVAATVGSRHSLAIIMPRCDVTAGQYYSQLMTTATLAATGQQLHSSLSMGSMLNTAQCLKIMATVLQMTP